MTAPADLDLHYDETDSSPTPVERASVQATQDRYKLRKQLVSMARVRRQIVISKVEANVPEATPVAQDAPKPKNPKSRVNIRREPAEVRLAIGGENFLIQKRGRGVTIQHPRWSLMGSGKTLRDAEVSLRHEAGIVVRVYGAMPAASLDDEAARQFAFALRIAVR